MLKRPIQMIALACAAMCGAACTIQAPQTVVITATFDPTSYTPPAPDTIAGSTSTVAPTLSDDLIVPTPDVPRSSSVAIVGEYTVQPGDTLSGIAVQFGVAVEVLQELNGIENPDFLAAGQVLRLPETPIEQGIGFKIIPDSRLVRAPGSRSFDIEGFIAQQQGYIAAASDEVNGEILSGAQIVRRVAAEFSVDARILLTLLELKSQWLTESTISDSARDFPLQAPVMLSGVERRGLYRQLTWAADQLNAGYYGWKGRGLSFIDFEDGVRLIVAPELNAGTVAVQYLLSRNTDYVTWRDQVSSGGVYAIYTRFFGDPFANPIEPLVPSELAQPELTFPFASGEVWYYTGGHHGGWGTGSAWAAVDFAPPDDRPDDSPSCYVSDYFATAVADGVIARSEAGSVTLDLDGDGDDTTGWVVLYLHIDNQDRVAAGARVTAGDRIGRPSCEGGFSTATHLHIARLYNGEWIPATCETCAAGQERPPFVMSGWAIVGFAGQEYQGIMTRGTEQRIAEQGRLIEENRVSW